MEPGYIGRYETYSVLGQGGMGTVYKARDPLMDRWVAIKTLTVQDERQRARFEQEVQAAGNLHHPHIVTIYDVGTAGELAYLVMELVEGGTLANLLVSPLPWAEAISLLLPICQALAYAHSQRVIHRDVKPANILFSTEEEVKLADFGVARLEIAHRLTTSTSTVGTPLYTAPEQIRDERVDGRADLFSLGIVLFELVTGRHPFIGKTLAQVVYRLTQPEPVDLKPLAALAPAALVEVAERALSKDPAARFPDAEAMASALTACLEQPTPISSFSQPPDSPSLRLEYVASNLSLSPAEEALLRTAFAGHDRLYLEREFKRGYSGARVLLATPMRSGRRLTKMVLKLDTPAAIDQEWQAYQEFVADILPPTAARITQRPVYAPEGHLALVWYTFAGELGQTAPESLREYYARHSGQEVATLLNKAVFETFGPHWWQQRTTDNIILRQEYDRLLPVHLMVRPHLLTGETPRTLVAGEVNVSHYRTFRSGQVVQIQGFIVAEIEADRGEITLQGLPLSGSPTNPIRVRVVGLEMDQITHQIGEVIPTFIGTVVATRHDLLRQLVQPGFPDQDLNQKHLIIEGHIYPNPLFDYNSLLDRLVTTMTSIIHGDLNLENILVTPELDLAWLIDFATTRQGHTLADFMRLETQVITKLLPQPQAKPGEVVRLIQALHRPDASPRGLPARLKKPFVVLTAIRQIVKTCLNNRQSWDEYYLGLVITLLGALKFKELDVPTRQLTLLAAAAVRGLIEVPAPPAPLPPPPRAWLKWAVGAIGLIGLVVLASLGLWFWRPSTSPGPATLSAESPVVVVVPSATPTLTRTPTPIQTLSPSPTPLPPTRGEGIVGGSLNIHSGPGSDYPVVGTVPDGTPVQVTGRSADGRWWQIAHPGGPGGYGWILAEFVELQETFILPIALASPPPTATPTPTITPIPSATPVPTPSPIPISTIPGSVDYQVFFAANLDGEYRIYTMSLGDNRPVQLTNGPGDEGRPALSPDGQNLAFASSRNGNLDIFILNLTSRELKQLTFDPEHDHTPAWSPDGGRIAFQSKRAGNYDIYVMDADGSHQIALTTDPADDYWAVWSPDGGQILFESRRDTGDRSQLYLMNADGSDQTRFLSSDGNDGMPAWSRTGRIAFYSDRDGNRELYLLDGLGATPERLTVNETNDWFPAWSPDGRYLAYTSGDDKEGEVYVMDMTDQRIWQLTYDDADSSDPIIAFAVSPLEAPAVTPEVTGPTPATLRVCQTNPAPEFQVLWNLYGAEMGCPLAPGEVIPTIAEERFEGGHMFWRNDPADLYVVYDRLRDGTLLLSGRWENPQTPWDGSDPDGVGMSPPPGLVEPKRGFGWLWRTHLGGPEGPLGWALDREYGFDNVGRAQQFEKGIAFKGSGPNVYALLNDGRFLAYRP